MGNLELLISFALVPSVTALYSPTLEGSLRADLFQSYEKDTRSSAEVNIECNIKFLSIKDLNTREQTMSSVAYFTFTWTDDRLKWNHMLNYSSVIKAIYSTEDKLFIPPVVVENSVSNLGLISVPTLPIEIKSNGFILWSPGDIYETSCDIDTTFYPFDKQTCIITLTTRGYSKDKLNLELGTVPIVWSAYKENGEWTVVTSSSWVTTTDRDRIPYSQINFSFTFKRRTAFHLMNTIIPMFLLVSMTCFVFRIPVDAGEKLGYCLTVLLAFAVYLTLISDNIPTTSTHTSYLSIFMNVMLSLGVSSVILTIHIINIYFKPEEDEIPLYLKVLAKITARISFFNKERCCCKKSDSKVSDAVLENEDKKREIDAGNENIEESLTWQEIAKKMDILLFFPFVNTLYSWNSESSLRRDLFSSYEKDSRPSPTVDILCNIKLLSIKDLNTREQTMSSVAYFTFTWLDSRLNWTDNILYNNDIQAIYSTESTVFTPPIVVENSVSDLGLIRDLTLPIEILKTGDITWTPGDVYDTSCDIDTTYYPFDVQTCVITLTTRGYSNNQLSLKLGGNPIVQSAYQENGEWTLVTTSSSTSIAHHDLVPYSQINFSFTFKRRIAFHLMNTIIPMVLLVSMTCYVFKIPVDAGEKLGYCLTVLLAFAVYLTLVSDNIPTTSTHICYLSVYLNVMLAFGVTSVLLTIHILDIHFKPEDKKIPGYFRAFMKFSSRVCCWHEAKCCNKGHTEVSVIAVTEKENEVNRKNSDIENTEESFTWQEIAKKMDEFLFFMYASIFIVFTVIFVIIMMIGSSM